MKATAFDAHRRRIVAAGAGAAAFLLLRPAAFAQPGAVVVDGAGRKVTLPARVQRIYAAGPPASALVFAVAPDRLLGWANPWRDAEKPYIPAKYLELPVLGA